MSRQFSIPTVLRMVPNALLQQLLAELGHDDFDPKWDELRQGDIEPLNGYIRELPLEQSNEIESVLRSVFDLACDSGFDALLEAAAIRGHDDLGTEAPDDIGLYGKAMWVWLNYRDAVKNALIIHHVDQLAWWRKRKDLPTIEPDNSPEATEVLETEICALLKSQGRGKDCTVETLARGDVRYFFAYPDDFAQNVVVHDANGILTPAIFRQTMLIVFAYDQEEGSLELFTKLSKKLKEQLEEVFASAILHWDLGRHEPEAAYEMNQLKDPAFDLTTDPADALHVAIRTMRLSAKHGGRRIRVETASDDNIHNAINDCLAFDVMPLSEWNVTQVTFCFEFLPLDGRKAWRQSFEITYPRSCTLRNARPERVEVIQKYLRRWGIDGAPANKRSPVAVGA